ncbi:MAG: 3-deoxy-8-phosphooctulonate synthase [Planctomycetota bacterium]
MPDLFVIAGPCVIESRDVCLQVGQAVKAACEQAGVDYIFKASFDKANRSSASSYRGPGVEDGLDILRDVGQELGVRTVTDVHEPEHPATAAEVVDVLQVPAFLARQTSLLTACGKTGKIVNIKKGQFMAPSEMATAVDKVKAAGESEVWLTERGTFFGYGRLVNDFGGLRTMAQTGCPVVFDATHSTQTPASLGGKSGGDPTLAPILARAAVAAGVDGVFIECHPDPTNAKSDAASMMRLDDVPRLIDELAGLATLRTSWQGG